MSLRDHLNLTGITVTRRTVTQDSYGGQVVTSATATISRGSMWSPSQGDRLVSEKMARSSTHVLAVEPGAYDWADGDVEVSHGGVTYRVTGPADDVALRGVLTLVGLQRLS